MSETTCFSRRVAVLSDALSNAWPNARAARSVRAVLGRLCRALLGRALLAALLVALVPAWVAGAEESPLPVRELAPGVWFHSGQHASVDSPEREDIANIGFIVGKRCVAVIDSGGSVATGRRLLAALRGVTELPVCYVINTHIHFDHLLGNSALADAATEFVGHAGLVQAVEENRAFFASRFPESLGGLPPERAVIGPGIQVGDSLELDLGERPLYLKAWPPAHSHNDLTVLDRASGVLWCGDLLFRERLPVLDGNLAGWLRALAALPGAGVRWIVPGHGAPAQDWEEAVTAQHRYLLELRATVTTGLDQGLFLEQILEQARQQPPGSWLLFEEAHPRNVHRAFIELEWE